MNKILKISGLLFVFVAAGFLSCSDEEIDSKPDAVRPVIIPERIATGTNDFAFDFFKNLQQAEGSSGNLFVSPLSLHMALGMLLNGAEEETAEELLKTLKMEGVSLTDLNKAYQTLINDMPVADAKVTLGLANSVWYEKSFQVETDFTNILKQSFNAEVTGLDFNRAAVNKINQWASDKTNGKINTVLDQIDPEAVMFLLNALYFKGDWTTKFDVKNTVDKPFRLETGADKTVKMMFTTSDFAISASEKFTAVKLPYGNEQFEMTLLLPQNGNSIAAVMDEMTMSKWAKVKSDVTPTGIKLGLPRFILKYSKTLNAILQNMGMNKAFVNAAQFGKLSKATSVKVDFVQQDTYLGIDEKGTEAAAVTTIGMIPTNVGPGPREIIFDRPFGVMISEKTSNTILFMGRIMNPESK